MKKLIAITITSIAALVFAVAPTAFADDYTNDDSQDASLNGPEVPVDPPDAGPQGNNGGDDQDPEDPGDVENDIEQFKDLNAQADRAAEAGDWGKAIKLWQQSVQYDRSPYPPCRGALQQTYIQVAQEVMRKIQSQDLDPVDALRYFRAEVTNNWGDSPCDAP